MANRVLLLAAFLFIASYSFGQKAKINEANKQMNKVTEAKILNKTEEELEALKKAKEAIDIALADPSGNSNAKAWLTKSLVYITMQENPTLKSDNPYQEGLDALKKAIELDAKIAKDDQALNLIINGSYYLFNDGILAYNNSSFNESYEYFEQTIGWLGNEKNAKFSNAPVVDTIRSQSKLFMGYNSFYSNNFDKAIQILNEVSSDPILANESNIYLMLAQAYEKKGDQQAQIKALEEGKKKFPTDKNLSNAEINYYISSGQTEQLIGKIEEAAQKEPDNPEYPFNLGILYSNLARPSDGSNAPENAEELAEKAEQYYSKALSLSGDNPNYNYQLGAYFFNYAVEINNQMNNLGGSRSDLAKYNTLEKERGQYYEKAIPLLENSVSIYEKDIAALNNEQKNFFAQALEALSKIYATQNNLDKASEVKKKLNDFLK